MKTLVTRCAALPVQGAFPRIGPTGRTCSPDRASRSKHGAQDPQSIAFFGCSDNQAGNLCTGTGWVCPKLRPHPPAREAYRNPPPRAKRLTETPLPARRLPEIHPFRAKASRNSLLRSVSLWGCGLLRRQIPHSLASLSSRQGCDELRQQPTEHDADKGCGNLVNHAHRSLPGRERVVRPSRVQDVPGRLAPLRAGLSRFARALGLLRLLRRGPPLHAAPQAIHHLPPRVQAVALVDAVSLAHRARSLTAACGLRQGRRAAPPARPLPCPRQRPAGRPHRRPARRRCCRGCRAGFRLLRSASEPAS